MSKAKRFNHKATYVMEPCVVLSICLSVDLRVRIYTDVLSIYVYATILRSATPIKGRKDAKNPALCTFIITFVVSFYAFVFMTVTSQTPPLLFDQLERVICFIDVGMISRKRSSHSNTISGAQRRVQTFFVYSDV